MGLRLQLRKQQAEAGDIILLYGDESEALTHPYLARAWAKSGADLRVPAPGQAKKVAMLGSLDHLTRQLIVHTSPTKRSSDFIAHLEQLDRLHGPQPGRQAKPVVLVEDNGPIHTSKRSLSALAARAHWLTVEWLPKYAPELNEIEPVWRDLKAHHLAHQTFTDADALDQAIHDAVIELNRERIPNPLAGRRVLLRPPEWPAGNSACPMEDPGHAYRGAFSSLLIWNGGGEWVGDSCQIGTVTSQFIAAVPNTSPTRNRAGVGGWHACKVCIEGSGLFAPLDQTRSRDTWLERISEQFWR